MDAKKTAVRFARSSQALNWLKTRLWEPGILTYLKAARGAGTNVPSGITVFGEMVAILWSEGNKVGALELERLWNDVLKDHAFHLHCAYPRWILQDGSDNLLLKSICDEHSSVLGHVEDLKLSA